MEIRKVCIPNHITFADLEIEVTGERSISLNLDLIKELFMLNGLDYEFFVNSHETNLTELLHNWYGWHTHLGGRALPIFENLSRREIIGNKFNEGHASYIICLPG